MFWHSIRHLFSCSTWHSHILSGIFMYSDMLNYLYSDSLYETYSDEKSDILWLTSIYSIPIFWYSDILKIWARWSPGRGAEETSGEHQSAVGAIIWNNYMHREIWKTPRKGSMKSLMYICWLSVPEWMCCILRKTVGKTPQSLRNMCPHGRYQCLTASPWSICSEILSIAK